MIGRILVPLDGSPLAESILPSVVEFARLTGARVTLVRVVESVTEDDDMRNAERAFERVEGEPLNPLAAVEIAVQPYLASVAERLTKEGLEVDTLVLSGQAADRIIESAHGFDLIAMATHGRSGIGRWVYGSVADKVLRGAGVPVLLVRARADGPVATGHPRRILAPLDGSAVAEQALPLATAVAKAAGAELVLAQSVFWAEMAAGGYPYGDGTMIQADDMLEQAEAGARAYLGEIAQRLTAEGLTVRVVIGFDPAADAILSAAEEEHADLIVMSTHGRSGVGRWVFGSVADRVLRGAATPVLLVRAGGGEGQDSMKITEVNVFQIEGGARDGLALYETAREGLTPGEVSPYRQVFTEIKTDDGLIGVTQGGSPEVKAAGQLLLGDDPLAVEYLWEKLFNTGYHRQLLPVIARLDLALWDLAGKARGEPVYRLLGGPTRERLRAYAGMLGFSTEPEAAARRSAEWVDKGFTALKWYLPCNALDGAEGLRRNVALVKAVRQAVGDDIEIMVDCLLANPRVNSVLYAIELARRLEEHRPTWLEEPLPFDDLDAHAALARATRIPLAFGEHHYSRWQIRQLIESGAPSVLQPDPNAAGGVTEMRKIIALASTYGVPVVPHANESCRNAVHLLFASPERTCPLGEWGVKINHNVQYFYRDFYEPKDGYFHLPSGPGFGYELDEAKILRRTEL